MKILTDPCAGRPCAGTGCAHEQSFAELVAHDQALGLYAPATPRHETCGDTSTGMFGRLLGPCTRRPRHPEPFHRDARGTEWRNHEDTPTTLDPATIDTSGTVATITAADLADIIQTVQNARTFGQHPAGDDGATILPDFTPADRARRNRYAAAIRDRIKALTTPTVLTWNPPAAGATEYDIADAVLAERDEELAELSDQRDKLAAALDKVIRFNKLTAEGSCRVQAVDQARDTLSFIDPATRAIVDRPKEEQP
jgi:hypothetical protein